MKHLETGRSITCETRPHRTRERRLLFDRDRFLPDTSLLAVGAAADVVIGAEGPVLGATSMACWMRSSRAFSRTSKLASTLVDTKSSIESNTSGSSVTIRLLAGTDTRGRDAFGGSSTAVAAERVDVDFDIL